MVLIKASILTKTPVRKYCASSKELWDYQIFIFKFTVQWQHIFQLSLTD